MSLTYNGRNNVCDGKEAVAACCSVVSALQKS
jgi:hypothetical protein